MKKELSPKAEKLSIYHSVSLQYVPTLMYGHKLWVVTEKIIWAPGQDAPWKSPFRGVLATSNWEETPGQTQNMLEGSCISPGLRTPWRSTQKELVNVNGEEYVWVSLLSLIPP